MKTFAFILLFLSTTVARSQENMTRQACVDFLKNYYRDFKTGFDIDGKHYTLTDNYSLQFNNCDFLMTYNAYDLKNNAIKTVTLLFNWMDIIEIDADGADIITEIQDSTKWTANCIIKLKSKKENFYIKVNYDGPDYDTEKMPVYRVMKRLNELCH